MVLKYSGSFTPAADVLNQFAYSHLALFVCVHGVFIKRAKPHTLAVPHALKLLPHALNGGTAS